MGDNNHIFLNNEHFLAGLKRGAASKTFSELTKKAEEGAHPSEEMLYDYALGETDDAASRKIRSHIAVCSACSQEVLQIRGLEDEIGNDLIQRFAPPSFASRFKIWISGQISFFKPGRTYLIPGFGAAAACLILLAWWFIGQPPETGMMIAESYQSVISTQGHAVVNVTFPWEYPKDTFGFFSAADYTSAGKAFGAGLAAGRQELSGKTDFVTPDLLSPENPRLPWSDTEWSDYFSAGKWCLLLKHACQADSPQMTPEFWKRQQIVLERFRKDFKNRSAAEDEAQRLIVFFDFIEQVFAGGRVSMSKRDCRSVADEADRLIGRMF